MKNQKKLFKKKKKKKSFLLRKKKNIYIYILDPIFNCCQLKYMHISHDLRTYEISAPLCSLKNISIDQRYFFCIFTTLIYQYMRKKVRQKYCYSCRTNIFIEFHHFMKKEQKQLQIKQLKQNIFKSTGIYGFL